MWSFLKTRPESDVNDLHFSVSHTKGEEFHIHEVTNICAYAIFKRKKCFYKLLNLQALDLQSYFRMIFAAIIMDDLQALQAIEKQGIPFCP